MVRITLKAARVNAGYSAEEAAKKLGCSRRTLLKYEKENKVLSWPVASKIPEVYGIGLDSIILSPMLTESEVTDEASN